MGLTLTGSFTVIVPIKRLVAAKTRLEVEPDRRRRAVLAMTDRVISASLAAHSVGRVLVVSDDAEVGRTALSAGAEVSGQGPRPGLNAAVMHGIATSVRCWGPTPVAAIMGDLAYLEANDVDIALAEAAGLGRAFVADRFGTGTTAVAALDPDGCTPLFGPDSARFHVAAGLRPVRSAVPTLRHDVDTVADLVPRVQR